VSKVECGGEWVYHGLGEWWGVGVQPEFGVVVFQWCRGEFISFRGLFCGRRGGGYGRG